MVVNSFSKWLEDQKKANMIQNRGTELRQGKNSNLLELVHNEKQEKIPVL